MTTLTGDQGVVLRIVRDAARPVSPAEVAQLMGAPRTPGGAAKTLLALHRRGLVGREWGGRSAVFTALPELAEVSE